MARRDQEFQTIRSEGGLLPPDLLRRVLDPRSSLAGTKPEDYGLPPGERLNETITQSWNRLRKHWAEFRVGSKNLPENEAGTGLTNDKWSLPLLRELGFGLLPTSVGPVVGVRSYAISRFLGPVPVHLVGCGLSLDRRAAGQRGAASVNPHGLVQEFLNRSSGHIWAILSNGLRLRVLRDNQALSRQSFLEFDLEAMFAGEVYSDFVLFWLLAHATRFAPRDGDRPESCWLEQWTKEAEEQGTRALGDLRGGVERALQILGEGFTGHPRNTALRDALRTGQVPLADFHGQLLRVVYRLIFLFVAEDRRLDGESLLHPRDKSDAARAARERYTAHYSTVRLRELAGEIKGSRHGDLWGQFQLLVGALSGGIAFAEAREVLALPALGSFLWDAASTAALNEAELTNHDLLEALRHLAFTRQGRVLRPVDYKNLGAEELGGVYESLLALTPQISADGARFSFAEFAGSERKTSGSYYTPDSLVQCLLDSALDPVVDEAIKNKVGAEAEKAILALKVCDPAVGSGHFLVGAAHRLSRHLARVRALAQGESEPSPTLYQHALRDVIGRCLYGVDVNPMAVELCKVSLWMEALEAGRPLTFLDSHIQCGDALLGATRDLMAAGIPDAAFTPVDGDDPEVARRLKLRNAEERKGQRSLFTLSTESPETDVVAEAALLEGASDIDIAAIRDKQGRWERLCRSSTYKDSWFRADAWCAGFFWPKRPGEPEGCAVTQDLWLHLSADVTAASQATRKLVHELAQTYRFFHWHLAFPTVCASTLPSTATGYDSDVGFDVLIGNPPWERVSLKEREFFAGRDDQISRETNSERRALLIKELATSNPGLYRDFLAARYSALRTKLFLSSSGRFPMTGVGDINTHALFAELARDLRKSQGRAGIIVQTQLVTEATYSDFTKDLVTRQQIVSCYAFENERKVFPGAHHSTRFILLTLGDKSASIEMASGLFETSWLAERERRYRLSSSDVARMNPTTFALPQFRTSRDAETAAHLHAEHPPLKRGERFRSRLTISRVMHDKDDGPVISWNRLDSIEKGRLPILESKLFSQYNHRFASYANVSAEDIRAGRPQRTEEASLQDCSFIVSPRKWVALGDTPERFSQSPRAWLLHIRKIARNIDWRTAIASITPKWPNNGSCAWVRNDLYTVADYLYLLAVLNSFVFDYLLRQKVAGANVNAYQLFQVPVPVFPTEEATQWHFEAAARAFELSYTCVDLEDLASEAGWCTTGVPRPPFLWSQGRRAQLRYELDAIVARLYGVTAEELDWILDARPPSESFRVLREAEERELGGFITKKRIREECARSRDVPTSTPFPSGTCESSLADTLRARHLEERRQIDATPLEFIALDSPEATDDE